MPARTYLKLYWVVMTNFAMVLVLLAPALQEAPLSTLRARLQLLRDQAPQYTPSRGATPELTEAKHQFRDWIESQLPELEEDGDILAFSQTLQAALDEAELFCTDHRSECGDNILGYVDGIRMNREGDFLVVVTATGIWCGYDESAYAYAWESSGWQRVWETEQNTYTDTGYRPQTIHDVQISSEDTNGNRLLMTLGSQASCSGSFKDLYIRVWQMAADYQTQAVLDRTEFANDGYPPVRGQARPGEVLVSFNAGGTLAGDPYWAVRHFQVRDGTAVQVDPVAVRPRDFVIHWLSTPWEESQSRSDSPSLEAWHTELYREDGVGDFPDPTLQCTTSADLWQVGTYFFEGPKRYYRVRWQAPYSFTMVDINEAPYPDCTLANPQGDAYPQLFAADPE